MSLTWHPRADRDYFNVRQLRWPEGHRWGGRWRDDGGSGGGSDFRPGDTIERADGTTVGRVTGVDERGNVTLQMISSHPAKGPRAQEARREQVLRLSPEAVLRILETGLDNPDVAPSPLAIKLLTDENGVRHQDFQAFYSTATVLPDGSISRVYDKKRPEQRHAREREHKKWIKEAMKDAAPSNDKRVLFTAGVTASGKSSMRPFLEENGSWPENAPNVDPDWVKDQMPEYKELKESGDLLAAALAHEESSDVSKQILKRANAMGSNVTVDGTGNGAEGNFLKKIREQKALGYRVSIAMADVPTELAVERAIDRMDKEGRAVSIPNIRQIHQHVMRNHLEWRDSPDVDEWTMFSTETRPSTLIARGGGGSYEVIDEQLYGEAVARAETDTDTPIVAEPTRAHSLERVVTSDIEVAVQAMIDGKPVQLRQPREVSVLLDRLRTVAREMEERGEDAPNFDLCKVTVRGTNIFCVGNKGVPRIKMPQFSGRSVRPGSPADKLPRDKDGSVDISKQWRDHLRSRGVTVASEVEYASNLRATQRELNGVKVSQVMKAMRDGKLKRQTPIFVSADNYVLDGHHGWAATVGVDLEDGVHDLTMPVERVNMPITELLIEANLFAAKMGMLGQSVADNRRK